MVVCLLGKTHIQPQIHATLPISSCRRSESWLAFVSDQRCWVLCYNLFVHRLFALCPQHIHTLHLSLLFSCRLFSSLLFIQLPSCLSPQPSLNLLNNPPPGATPAFLSTLLSLFSSFRLLHVAFLGSRSFTPPRSITLSSRSSFLSSPTGTGFPITINALSSERHFS